MTACDPVARRHDIVFFPQSDSLASDSISIHHADTLAIAQFARDIEDRDQPLS
jgi:hypothetical protein